VHVLPVFFLQQISQNQEDEQKNKDAGANVFTRLLIGFAEIIEKRHQIVNQLVVLRFAQAARLDDVETDNNLLLLAIAGCLGLLLRHLESLQLGQHMRHTDIVEHPVVDAQALARFVDVETAQVIVQPVSAA